MRWGCDRPVSLSRQSRTDGTARGSMRELQDDDLAGTPRSPLSHRQQAMGGSGEERAAHSPPLRDPGGCDRMTREMECSYCGHVVLDPCWDFSEAVRCGRY